MPGGLLGGFLFAAVHKTSIPLWLRCYPDAVFPKFLRWWFLLSGRRSARLPYDGGDALKANFEEGIDFDSRKGGNQTKGRGGGRKAETQDGNLISRNKPENQDDFDSSILMNQTFDSGLNRNQKITPSKQGRGETDEALWNQTKQIKNRQFWFHKIVEPNKNVEATHGASRLS
jgi:hypothetical protein